MELQGVTFSAATSEGNSQVPPAGDTEIDESTRNVLDQAVEDELNFSKVSMSRKQRGLMEAIQVKYFSAFIYLVCELFKFSNSCLDITNKFYLS